MAVTASTHAFVMKDPFENMPDGSFYELPLFDVGISIFY